MQAWKGSSRLQQLCIRFAVLFQMTVRDGRVKRTETVSNSTHPEWDEELQFIVDDPDTQSVSVIVKDDDAFNDTVSLVNPDTSTKVCVCEKRSWAAAAAAASSPVTRKPELMYALCCGSYCRPASDIQPCVQSTAL